MKTSNKRTEELAQQIYHCKEVFEGKIKPIEAFYEIFGDLIRCKESYSAEIKKIGEKLFKKKGECIK